MFKLTDVPLSILNRALDLFGKERETTPKHAWDALLHAEGSIDVHRERLSLTPFAQAVAEYMSLSGPWNEDDGEYAGENGYQVETG